MVELALARYQDRLILNVYIRERDVKVNAADGTMLGSVSDDPGDKDD